MPGQAKHAAGDSCQGCLASASHPRTEEDAVGSGCSSHSVGKRQFPSHHLLKTGVKHSNTSHHLPNQPSLLYPFCNHLTPLSGPSTAPDSGLLFTAQVGSLLCWASPVGRQSRQTQPLEALQAPGNADLPGAAHASFSSSCCLKPDTFWAQECRNMDHFLHD